MNGSILYILFFILFFQLTDISGDCFIVWWILTHFCHFLNVTFIQVFYLSQFCGLCYLLSAYILVFQEVCILGFSQGSRLCDGVSDLLWKLDHLQFWEDLWKCRKRSWKIREKESLTRSSESVAMDRPVGDFREISEAAAGTLWEKLKVS